MTAMLDSIRNCQSGSPWPDIRHPGKIVFFHNAMNWLPEVERDAIREAFRVECARPGLAVHSSP